MSTSSNRLLKYCSLRKSQLRIYPESTLHSQPDCHHKKAWFHPAYHLTIVKTQCQILVQREDDLSFR